MTDSEKSKGKRRGRKKLSAEDKRNHSITLRVNGPELEQIDLKRNSVKMDRAGYCRMSALESLPANVPEVNVATWVELGKIGINLNQYQRAINQGQATCYDLELLKKLDRTIEAIRGQLLKPGGEP